MYEVRLRLSRLGYINSFNFYKIDQNPSFSKPAALFENQNRVLTSIFKPLPIPNIRPYTDILIDIH